MAASEAITMRVRTSKAIGLIVMMAAPFAAVVLLTGTLLSERAMGLVTNQLPLDRQCI
jgi:hypothetical protein